MADEKRNRPRRMGMGRWMYNRMMMPIRLGIFLTIMRLIGLLVAGFVLFFLLSGGINQVKTGQSLVNYTLMWGHRVSGMIDDLVHGTNETFIITEDGIYFRDSVGDVPENSALDGLDDDVPDEAGKWYDSYIKDAVDGKTAEDENVEGSSDG